MLMPLLISPFLMLHACFTLNWMVHQSLCSVVYTISVDIDFLLIGHICDKNRNNLLPNTPPTPHDSDSKGLDDWTPYTNHLQFEVADFLFHQNQMSAGDINLLLNLWAASLSIHGDKPPFSNATCLYNTIDSTYLSNVPWDSFSLQYNETQPKRDILS